MSERVWRLAGAAIVLGIAALMAGCASRPVGDFGRAAPGVVHDFAMPAIGTFMAKARHEPVSNFNLTDQETEMYDRVWRFLVAPHAKDWFYDTAVEMQRTRISRATDVRFAVDRYYQWLKRADYGSSRTRYATVGRHIGADIDTIPTTFASICAVLEIDRQRAIALAGLSGLEAQVGADVAARSVENNKHINWFVRALTYRYQSYDYALNHLLVETPDKQSVFVDHALQQLKSYVDQANRGAFCPRPGERVATSEQAAIPSRYGQRSYGVEPLSLK